MKVLESLIGSKIVGVIFILDYMQLQLEAISSATSIIINAYIWPTVMIEEEIFTIEKSGFRDALCGLIDKVIDDVSGSVEQEVILKIENSSLIFNVAEAAKNNPEALTISANGGKLFCVW